MQYRKVYLTANEINTIKAALKQCGTDTSYRSPYPYPVSISDLLDEGEVT